jgi:hypothetical protein
MCKVFAAVTRLLLVELRKWIIFKALVTGIDLKIWPILTSLLFIKKIVFGHFTRICMGLENLKSITASKTLQRAFLSNQLAMVWI